ncbi:MAG: HDOD domain-containing protein [Methyloprofundus sp.]|nr:HDOD domain-containing protein [Methyloprofundus sp.]
MTKITEEQFVVFVEQMPAFPKSVHKLMQLTANEDAATRDIVALIESDPVMTVKILKVINSAFYSLPQKITSIQRALVHIGVNTIKNLALSIAAIGVINSQNRAGFDINQFLEHSLATAVISKKLAERMQVPLQESSDYFVAGLLHDFGKIVFAQFMPDEFKQALEQSRVQQVDLHITELKYIGISHAHAGRMLAKNWELPASLANAIDLHHNKEGDNLLWHCVFAANQIAKTYQIGSAGNPIVAPYSPKTQAFFGMTMDELMTELGDIAMIKAEVQQKLELK